MPRPTFNQQTGAGAEDQAKQGDRMLKAELLTKIEDFLWDGKKEEPDHYFREFLDKLRSDKFADVLLRLLTKGSHKRLGPNNKPENSPRIEHFLRWLIGVNENVLTKTSRRNKSHARTRDTPLVLSLKNKDHTVVETILKTKNLVGVLDYTEESEYGTCLHVAISNKSPLLQALTDKCKEYPDQFGKQDRDSNTPLHLLTMIVGDECREETLKNAVKGRFEIARDQSNLAHQTTNTAAIDNALQEDSGSSELESESSDSEEETNWKAEFRKPELRLQVLRTMFETLIENGSVETLQTALQQRNQNNMTPYQLRVHTIESSKHVKHFLRNFEARNLENLLRLAKRMIIVQDPIAKYIRTFCVRVFKNHDDVVKCLYQTGKERHIEFDLAGLQGPMIREEFLERLANHIQFESILRYVALPKLGVEPSKKAILAASKDPKMKIKTDLRVIFDWLRRNGVETIIKVAVIDHGEKAHKDSVIQEALTGFEVECWDWKKIDLCSNVICDSTKVVKEICLYWSGNSAILMGWASQEGFSNAEKFPKLKRIRLFIQEGYEEQTKLDEQAETFVKQMAIGVQHVPSEVFDTQNSPRIRVLWVRDNERFSHASDFTSSNENGQEPTIPWIAFMKSFSTFWKNANTGVKVNPVKIAVIDDGIDATRPDLQARIAMGKSFSPYVNSEEFMNAYFVPSGEHGTQMATLICNICPKPQLFIARLEERLTESGDRRITARSAAKAITWAVGCKVDIISMSWTIASPDKNNHDINELENAVKSATDAGILMFCSASDQGASRDEHSYPIGFKNTSCISIGGASALGKKLDWVNESAVNFLLPGKRIPFEDPETTSIFHKTGSSLATACATGLAGALLHWDRALGNVHKLEMEQGMSKAFRGLSERQDKFIDVEKNIEQRLAEKLSKLSKGRIRSPLKLQTLLWDDKVVQEALKELLEFIMERN